MFADRFIDIPLEIYVLKGINYSFEYCVGQYGAFESRWLKTTALGALSKNFIISDELNKKKEKLKGTSFAPDVELTISLPNARCHWK